MMIRIVLLAALPLLAAGCVVHGHAHGPAVAIEAGHVHSDSCGHYSWRGSWYHARHSHGPGCGHHYRGGMWVHID